MKNLTRRDLLKTSLAAPAVVAATTKNAKSDEAQAQTQTVAVPAETAASGSGRERLLLDFGWRFHLGHAADMAQDFGFRGNFSKTGNFGPAAALLFDDNDWRAVDLPHD
jgi:beta-galactosidase